MPLIHGPLITLEPHNNLTVPKHKSMSETVYISQCSGCIRISPWFYIENWL